MSEYISPVLTSVEALAPYRLRTLWGTGESLDVDVEGVLRRHAFLAPILDPEVFVRVHIGEGGGNIEWIDAEFGADNVYAWAKEQAAIASRAMPGYPVNLMKDTDTGAVVVDFIDIPFAHSVGDDEAEALRNAADALAAAFDIYEVRGEPIPPPSAPGVGQSVVSPSTD